MNNNNKENQEKKEHKEPPQGARESSPATGPGDETLEAAALRQVDSAKGDKGKGEKEFPKKDDEIKADPRKEKGPKHKKRDTQDTDEEQAAVHLPVEPEFMEKVIAINRITKVTKGGKKLSFSALVVVGDARGKVGYSLSKAAEVSIAIRKAMAVAKRNMRRISLEGSTIPHEIIGQCGGARVLLKPAGDGTGVIAAGPVRAVCDGAGIHNILTKCHRSNNPINVVKATMDGLLRLKSRPAKPEVLENASK